MAEALLNVVVANSPGDLDEIRAFWVHHNRHPESAPDFISVLIRARDEVLAPYILIACEDSRPIAMMIGRLEKAHLALRIGYLRLARIPLIQLVFVREGFLGELSTRVIDAMAARLRADLRAGIADRALFGNLVIGAELHTAVCRHFGALQRSGSSQIAEHWFAHLPTDFDSFLAQRSAKHRYAFRRLTKRFESLNEGRVTYAAFDKPAEVDAFCTAAESVARHTYQRGLGAGFFDNSENRQRLFVSARAGSLRGYVLYAEDRPLAFWAGERVGEVTYILWTAFDPRYRKYEIGTILFLKMLADLLRQGVRTIDFGPGGADYKERFGDLCLQEQDIFVYSLTPKGLITRSIGGLNNVANKVGRRLLDTLGITKRLKRVWRMGLAARVGGANDESEGSRPPAPILEVSRRR